jgi:hypothetical protein
MGESFISDFFHKQTDTRLVRETSTFRGIYRFCVRYMMNWVQPEILSDMRNKKSEEN